MATALITQKGFKASVIQCHPQCRVMPSHGLHECVDCVAIEHAVLHTISQSQNSTVLGILNDVRPLAPAESEPCTAGKKTARPPVVCKETACAMQQDMTVHNTAATVHNGMCYVPLHAVTCRCAIVFRHTSTTVKWAHRSAVTECNDM